MAKRKKSKPAERRRPRSEIDRNYFFGDIFIKTGVAVGVVMGMIALYTPFTVADVWRSDMIDYLVIMTTFGIIGITCFLVGRHLRKTATHWDFD